MPRQSISQPSHAFTFRVNLIKKIKLGNSWRFAPVVPESNGKLKDKALIGEKIEVHTEGSYYIEWRENGRRLCEKVYKDEALERARRKALELEAMKQGLIQTSSSLVEFRPQENPATNRKEERENSPERKPDASKNRITMGKAVDDYLDFIKAHCKKRTFLTYRYTIGTLLRTAYQKTFVDEVTRQDIIDFMTYCYKQGLGNRTVYDNLVVVLQLFKRHGKSRLIEKSDWPEYVETIRPIYEAEELEAMFAAATEDQATLLKFLLSSGLRNQEVRYLLWRDIDFRHPLSALRLSCSGATLQRIGRREPFHFPQVFGTAEGIENPQRCLAQQAGFSKPLRKPGQRNGHDREESCKARRTKLRSVHHQARQQMFRRAVLPELLSSQISPHFCN